MDKKELKILKYQLKFFENPKKHEGRLSNILIILWLFCVAAFAILTDLTSKGDLSNILAFFIVAFIGALIGYFYAFYSSVSQIKHLYKYIDIDAIKERIKEIET